MAIEPLWLFVKREYVFTLAFTKEGVETSINKTEATVHQKIGLAILGASQEDDVLTSKEIRERVHKYYPDIPAGSILPSDLCCNIKNEDSSSGILHIFEKVSRNRYKVLPHHIIKKFL